jgi:HD superfamily phosphohydrolase YqeK
LTTSFLATAPRAIPASGPDIVGAASSHWAERVPVTLPDWAVVTDDRRAHIERVAALLEAWADAMGVSHQERSRWLRAAALHDALKDAPMEQQRALAPGAWPIDAIRHGPAAAALAAQRGEDDDAGVLDAVRYHSVGYAGWDDVGRMLYLADYLEPGRTFLHEERRRLARRVPTDPVGVLCRVLEQRLTHHRRSGITPLPETLAFHKSLRCGGG